MTDLKQFKKSQYVVLQTLVIGKVALTIFYEKFSFELILQNFPLIVLIKLMPSINHFIKTIHTLIKKKPASSNSIHSIQSPKLLQQPPSHPTIPIQPSKYSLQTKKMKQTLQQPSNLAHGISSKDKIARGPRFIQLLKAHQKIVPFLQPEEMERLGLFDFRFVTRKIIKLALIEQKIKENKYQEFDELVKDLKLVFEMIGMYVPLNDPLQNDVKFFLNEVDKWKVQCDNGNVGTSSMMIAQDQQKQQSLRSATQKLSKTLQPLQPLQQPSPTHPTVQPNTKQSYNNRNIKHYQSQRKKKQQNYATMQQQQVKLNQMTKAYRLPVRSTLAQKLEMIYFLKSHETNEPFIHMIGDMYGIGKETEDQYVIKLDNSTCCSWLEVLQNNNGGGYGGQQMQHE